jgi:hypothetical protein
MSAQPAANATSTIPASVTVARTFSRKATSFYLMASALTRLAGLKFINDEFDERMTVLAAEHAEQAAFESGYGM